MAFSHRVSAQQDVLKESHILDRAGFFLSNGAGNFLLVAEKFLKSTASCPRPSPTPAVCIRAPCTPPPPTAGQRQPAPPVVVVFGRTSGRGIRAPPVPRVNHEYGQDSGGHRPQCRQSAYHHRLNTVNCYRSYRSNKGALTCR